MLKKIYNTVLYGFAIIGFILITGYVASISGLSDRAGLVDNDTDYFKKSRLLVEQKTYPWMSTVEYISLKEAMIGEKEVLSQIEKETNIKPRLLISILFVEQMRLYTSSRELFKKVFEPLKLLGVQSQFSWGVLGLKQETLIQIESNLRIEGGTVLDFTTDKPDEERFMRVTNEKDHYYTYLYAALFIRQIEKQWNDAGFNISNRPEILATLYNIGFANSKPNADPKVGGAEIEIGESKTSFGQLAYEFYYSNELVDVYPR